MSELTGKKCKPCEGGVPPLTRAQARALAKQLSAEWVLSPEGPYLRREFRFQDFYRTMSFVNALAHIANIGISLPGTGERPVAPVYEDGEKTVTLKGDHIAEEFQDLLEQYVARRFVRKSADSAAA